MKRFFPVLSILAVALCACGEGGPGGPGSSSDGFSCGPAMERVDSFMATFAGQEPTGDRYGGTAVVGTVDRMRGMSPRAAGIVVSAQHQQFVNLMTLIEYDENLQPVPYLAESWEFSDEMSRLTFHLRDDVYWHDGELTTANDVAFTYRTVTNEESIYPNPGFFQAYLPGEAAMEVVDSFTVTFHFTPHQDPLEIWRNLAILPEHILSQVPVGDLAGHPWAAQCPVGNGPFRFLSQVQDENWTFGANLAFPDELGGRPYLDRYVYRFIPEHATLLAELLTGGLDLFVQMLPDQAVSAEAEGIGVRSYEYPAIFFIAWNSRVPRLSDPRVRRALTLGINRPQLIEGVQLGKATLLNGSLPPGHWAFDPALADSLPYDTDRAIRLLEDAGWVDRDGDGVREDDKGDPLQIELIYNQNQERQRVAEIVRVQLQEIGVELLPTMLDETTWADRIQGADRAFEGSIITFETGFRIDDRDLFHSAVFDVEGSWAFSGTRDPVLDRYLDTLQLIPDREVAYPLWQEYQLRLMELQPYTFLYSAHRRNGVAPRLQNAVTDTRGDWATIRNWWIAPEDRERN